MATHWRSWPPRYKVGSAYVSQAATGKAAMKLLPLLSVALIGMEIFTPRTALAQSSSYCSGYASDYARRMSAGGVVGGAAVGAGTGAVIGGIANGRRGARRGAGIGAAVGAVGGGVRRANSYDYHYREAYARCMRSR